MLNLSGQGSFAEALAIVNIGSLICRMDLPQQLMLCQQEVLSLHHCQREKVEAMKEESEASDDDMGYSLLAKPLL